MGHVGFEVLGTDVESGAGFMSLEVRGQVCRQHRSLRQAATPPNPKKEGGEAGAEDRGLPALPVFPAGCFPGASVCFSHVCSRNLPLVRKCRLHKDNDVCVLFTVLTLAPRTGPDTWEVLS